MVVLVAAVVACVAAVPGGGRRGGPGGPGPASWSSGSRPCAPRRSALVHEARVTVAQASAEIARVEAVLEDTESVTATVDSATRLATRAFANPVVKVMALRAGTVGGLRRLRRAGAARSTARGPGGRRCCERPVWLAAGVAIGAGGTIVGRAEVKPRPHGQRWTAWPPKRGGGGEGVGPPARRDRGALRRWTPAGGEGGPGGRAAGMSSGHVQRRRRGSTDTSDVRPRAARGQAAPGVRGAGREGQ